jgi:molybdopterin synthase sulfur carrier subunit
MQILYFAWLREKLGVSAEDVTLPPTVTTVSDLIGILKTHSPEHEAAFGADNRIRCAVDQEFAGLDTLITKATEIAFFPPVTGG